MKNEDVWWVLDNIIDERICCLGSSWYLFGSVLEDCAAPSDIDILIIYDNPSTPSQIRENIENLVLIRPIHLIFMTLEEELETNFIASQRCIQFHPNNFLIMDPSS